jgi:hypothetical protein
MSDSEDRKQLLADACDEMERFRKRYRELKELADVFEAMRKVRTSKSAVA